VALAMKLLSSQFAVANAGGAFEKSYACKYFFPATVQST
jgi:hypothetical protein